MEQLRTRMLDDEIFACYRPRYPHISLANAKGSYRGWLRFRHLGAIVEHKCREATEEQRRHL
jgi:hypothetical protein